MAEMDNPAHSRKEYSYPRVIAVIARNGKCLRMQHFYDTADVLKAFPREMRKTA